MVPLNLKCWLSRKTFSDSIWTIGFIQLWIKSDFNIVPFRPLDLQESRKIIEILPEIQTEYNQSKKSDYRTFIIFLHF
jgi:hypothetical protein